MKPGRQFLTIVAITLVALPLAARFLPGSHPLLEAVGLLRPMTSLGIVPQAPVDSGQGQGWSGGGPTPVIAAEARRLPLVDVVTTVGSARGAQSVTLAPEVSGRLLALRVQPGDRVAVGDVMAELDAEAASLAVEKARLVLEDARATRQRLERLAASGATPLMVPVTGTPPTSTVMSLAAKVSEGSLRVKVSVSVAVLPCSVASPARSTLMVGAVVSLVGVGVVCVL